MLQAASWGSLSASYLHFLLLPFCGIGKGEGREEESEGEGTAELKRCKMGGAEAGTSLGKVAFGMSYQLKGDLGPTLAVVSQYMHCSNCSSSIAS